MVEMIFSTDEKGVEFGFFSPPNIESLTDLLEIALVISKCAAERNWKFYVDISGTKDSEEQTNANGLDQT